MRHLIMYLKCWIVPFWHFTLFTQELFDCVSYSRAYYISMYMITTMLMSHTQTKLYYYDSKLYDFHYTYNNYNGIKILFECTIAVLWLKQLYEHSTKEIRWQLCNFSYFLWILRLLFYKILIHKVHFNRDRSKHWFKSEAIDGWNIQDGYSDIQHSTKTVFLPKSDDNDKMFK